MSQKRDAVKLLYKLTRDIDKNLCPCIELTLSFSDYVVNADGVVLRQALRYGQELDRLHKQLVTADSSAEPAK